MTTLVVVAVSQERDAVMRDLPHGADVEVVVGGVGPVAAATATVRSLARGDYTTVVSAGIAGGFAGRADVGDIVVATASVAADLGCRTDERFLTLEDMGLDQPDRIAFDNAARWGERLSAHGLTAVTGDVVTLSCMTGTDVDAKHLSERFPSAVAEAMEGWGVTWAARDDSVTCGELRAVSNLIGKRDPSTWDIAAAFDSLSRASAILFAERS